MFSFPRPEMVEGRVETFYFYFIKDGVIFNRRPKNLYYLYSRLSIFKCEKKGNKSYYRLVKFVSIITVTPLTVSVEIQAKDVQKRKQKWEAPKTTASGMVLRNTD